MHDDLLIDFRNITETTDLVQPDYGPSTFKKLDMPFIDLSDYFARTMPLASVELHKVDWLEAKLEYVSNPKLTYKDIAGKYAVSLKTVKQHGSDEGWLERRRSVTKSVENKVIATLVEDAAQLTERHAELFRQAQELIAHQIDLAMAQSEAAEQLAASEGRSPTPRELPNTTNILTLAKALDIAVKGERICLGLPTSVSGRASAANDADADYFRYNKMSHDELCQLVKQTDAAINAAGKLT